MIAEKKLLIVTLLIFTTCFCFACDKTDAVQTYEGLNGETITDLGLYGAQRICEAEGIDSHSAIAVKLQSQKLNDLGYMRVIYVIVISNNVWIYEYDYNTLTGEVYDDTWAKQNLEW